ncbi:response regulator [Paenibacillus oryzisoli]|uniref:response regulator n=1 Tax=Paenibacillus oryzisoli TaxID=1850517 RepID=UPI003D2AE175
MYKLLIVDDEPTVRSGLKSYFDWSSFGVEVMGEADDGDVALSMIERERPDLVLTDVRMPKMDGISLSRHLSERYPESKIIFVSGHDEVNYLKSALKVSAVDYIFKPVDLDELRGVMARVVAELDAERAERRMTEELQVKLKEGMPLLREKFLLSLIGDREPTGLRDRIAFLGLDLPTDAAYWVMVISVDDLAEVLANRSERDWQLLSYSVLNICQELTERYMVGYVFEHRSGEFVGILRTAGSGGAEESVETLITLAADIRDNLERWLKIGVTIGIGDQVEWLTSLRHSYRQAREAADHKWYLGKNRIITMDSLETPETESGQHSTFDPALNEQLLSALKAADGDQLGEVLDRIFADLNRNRRDGLKYGRNVCLQIVLAASRLLLELNAQSPEWDAEESVLWDSLFERETLGEMRQMIESHLSVACERIGKKRTGKLANLVERVRAVIDERYAESGLTAADIGKAVYLTPTYVSLLFKQETGQTINEYLTQVRVERAKELLRDPYHKFYDICHAIGYTDPSYFTKLFKKATGMTPSAYRDNYA